VQLENSFTVPVPIDEAWRVLMDIERIAPCMPGAALDSVTGDDFTGRVKVKLGPINLTYQGKATFVERDEAGHRAVIDARGKDQRGNGTAAAVVTATLAGEGSTTRVDVLTDLNITGRPAQFGRGVMTDVGNKLLGQFADKLAAQLAAGDDVTVHEAAAAESQEPTVAKAATGAVAKAAATTAGVVEEAAMSVEGTAGDSPVAGVATTAGAAARKSAAAAADKAAAAEESAVSTPVEPAKATPAEASPAEATPATAAPAQSAPAAASVPDPTAPPSKSAPAAADATPAVAAPVEGSGSPAATPITGAKRAPSKPPAGTTAPPNRPAGGGPARSTPAAEPRRPLTSVEPEPIDLLAVAGGAALTRYAVPAAGAAALLLVVALLVRRRRRH
jgi:carbon monoxide dehydrogenase subunit G